MCQQIVQLCSGSTKPLLFAGAFLSLALAIAIGYTGCTTNALYRDVNPQIADERSLQYHLQLAAAGYLVLVTAFSCYTAYYDQKYSVRALSGLTTLNFAIAVVAILMVPTGKQLSEPFQDTLIQAAEKYNFSQASLPQGSDLLALPSSASGSGQVAAAAANQTRERQTRWALEQHEMNSYNATMIWDKLQARGCCGITNATELWQNKYGKIPKSCCSNPDKDLHLCKEVDKDHQQGCLALIESTRLNLLIVVGLIALVNFYLATISGISAYKTYSYSEASQNAYT